MIGGGSGGKLEDFPEAAGQAGPGDGVDKFFSQDARQDAWPSLHVLGIHGFLVVALR